MESENRTYLVCTIRPWNLAEYEKYSRALPGTWHLFRTKEELTFEAVSAINPRYIFFPHWSWIVPDTICSNFECICFHSSDVPYGRGGSPIQNLIIRGHQETRISVLRMEKELDAGPVYFKIPLSLKGSAQDIFESMGKIIGEAIRELITTNPVPVPQTGDAVVFRRRTGSENVLPTEGDLEHIYNHIRMLDVDTYPKSHIIHGDFRLEFTKADFDGDSMTASVKITRNKK